MRRISSDGAIGPHSLRVCGALLAVVIGASGCVPGAPAPTPTTGRECPTTLGPPPPDVLRCRLLRGSDEGAFPRTVTEADADAIVRALGEYSDAMTARREGRLDDAGLQGVLTSVNADCQAHSGLSCDTIIFSVRPR